MAYCKLCGKYECRKHSILIGRARNISGFSGSSPPEVFVGRYGYPHVNVGILSPEQYGDNKVMSSAEEWHAKKMGISDILRMRNMLIYGRKKDNVKRAALSNKFLGVVQEIAMADSSVASEFKLKKPIKKHDEKESRVPLIANAGEVENVRLQENPKIKKKVEYLVNDVDVKSNASMPELEKAGIGTSSIIKLLSAGLLGLKKNRKLVPTRWAITAVDDILSNKKIDEIKYFPEIQDYRVFTHNYLGNYYEILLIPRFWSFEVIEISLRGGVWRDSESIFRRKKYAESVTGAYYANRLAVCEYLMDVKKQTSVIVFREIRPEYYAPLGVGILRETTRSAMKSEARKFFNLKDALEDIQSRLRISVDRYLKDSFLMKELEQKRLKDYIKIADTRVQS